MRLTIAEQLTRLKLQTSKHKQSLYNINFHSALNLGEDGEDHINFWDQGKTRLGRALCHTTGLPINHPIFGRFKTMTGFWNFILSPSKDDELRSLTGRPLHSLVNRLTTRHNSRNSGKDKGEYYHVRNFRAIILDTYYIRVMASPEIRQLLAECDLEFDSYYIQADNGLRMRHRNFKWFIPMLNELRSAIQEERTPDYELFMSDPEIGIYHDVIPSCVSETLDARNRAKAERKLKLEMAREAKLLKELMERSNAEEAASVSADAARVSTVTAEKPEASTGVPAAIAEGLTPSPRVFDGDASSIAILTDTHSSFQPIPNGVIVYTDEHGNTQVEVATPEVFTKEDGAVTELVPVEVGDIEVEDNSMDVLEPVAEEPLATESEFTEADTTTASLESVAETVRRIADAQQDVGTFGHKLMSLVK